MGFFSGEDFSELERISHISNGDFNSCEIMKKTWLNNSNIAICHLAVLLLKITWLKDSDFKKNPTEVGKMREIYGKAREKYKITVHL